jgi:SAM-dependent methyltransferase
MSNPSAGSGAGRTDRPPDIVAMPAARQLPEAPAETGHEQLPYPSMPITLSQPQHLAALAALFGIDAPGAATARVLELGCAAGGNIIPLALRFPDARFTGIDLSPRHIAAGRDRIARLGVRNVELRQADLAQFDPAGRRYDYLICHGVFSWVPPPAQDAILRLCRDALVPNGAATISYNVLPGWHLRAVIRDLCLRYAGPDGTPQRRVALARAALARFAEAASPSDPYGRVLRTEARRLAGVPAAYILGEFLAPHNAPCHVGDFIARAAAAGLDYLCEADLAAAVPPTLDPALRGRLASLGGPERGGIEQEIDCLTGRLFRQSVVVPRTGRGCHAMVEAERLDHLHVASPLRPDPMQASGSGGFLDARGGSVAVKGPSVACAVAQLAAAYPATITLGELAATAPSAAEAARVRRAVLALAVAGRATLSSLPLRVGGARDSMPRAWSLARLEAESDQPWLTTLRHAAVPATPLLRALVPHLDGTNEREVLLARLACALDSGAVAMPEPGPVPAGVPGGREDAASRLLEPALAYLHRHAVLEPAAEVR